MAVPEPQKGSSVLKEYDVFFILDYLSRYVVETCGAPETVTVGIWSVCCITPLLVWAGTLTLSFFQPVVYATLARYTISVLTLVQVVLMLIFDSPPPVTGCGPQSSFPCGQVTLSAYGLTMFMLFDSGLHGQSGWWRIFVQLQYFLVCHSVLCLGMASPAAITAATILGGSTACVLHVSILRAAAGMDGGLLQRLITGIETWFGIRMIDDVSAFMHLDVSLGTGKTPPTNEQGTSHNASASRVTPPKFTMGASPLHMGYRQKNETKTT